MAIVILSPLKAEDYKTPIIGYHNVLRGGNVTATNSLAGFPASAVLNPLTYERWMPSSSSGGGLTIDVGSATQIDYVAMAAHTVGSAGAELIIDHSLNNSTWSGLWSDPLPDDSSFMLIFQPVTARYIRFRLNKPAEIGVVYAGRSLKMPHCIYGGHSPGALSRQTEIEHNLSMTGQFLGRSIVRQGLATSFSFQHLPALWYRDHFDPFVESALRFPFFMAWYPEKFPGEVMYAWTTDDIQPVNMGVRDLMAVSFGVEAVR